MERTIIIGTRGSDLALWQAHHVKGRLEEAGYSCELNIIKTQGDKIQHLSFDKMEGKGFFTKEIEAALLDCSIDLAIHSHKDLETTSPEGLTIAAVSERADPAELLLLRKEVTDTAQKWKLPAKAIVGTSSARRKSQLLFFRDDVELKDLRGNVPTRIQKLRDGQYDAIMLAAAGVKRLELDLSDLEVIELDPKEFIPAPAQGVLALQSREDDEEIQQAVASINNEEVASCIGIEREVLRMFQGGCQMPLGSYCEKEGNTFKLWVAMAEQWDAPIQRVYLEGNDAALAQQAVDQLRKKKSARIFISRELKPGSLFRKLLSQDGMVIKDHSLIRFEEIPFSEVPDSNWIFFSSRNAVRYFFNQHQGSLNRKVGAVGLATAAALDKQGHSPDFIGSGSDTLRIASDFKAIAGDEKVLFPMAEASRRTIQKALKAEQCIDLVTYRTLEDVAIELQAADVLVFTSPSNVRSYLRQFHIKPTQRVIAIGSTTRNELERNEVKEVSVPKEANELALAELVLSVIEE